MTAIPSVISALALHSGEHHVMEDVVRLLDFLACQSANRVRGLMP